MAFKSKRQVAAERVIRLCEKLLNTEPVVNVIINPCAGVENVYEPVEEKPIKEASRKKS